MKMKGKIKNGVLHIQDTQDSNFTVDIQISEPMKTAIECLQRTMAVIPVEAKIIRDNYVVIEAGIIWWNDAVRLEIRLPKEEFYIWLEPKDKGYHKLAAFIKKSYKDE